MDHGYWGNKITINCSGIIVKVLVSLRGGVGALQDGDRVGG